MQWVPAASDNAAMLTFLVKYRPIQTSIDIQKRNADDLSIIVETNRTTYVLSGLDPRFAYAVSVAASNGGGTGNFSGEIIVGCEFIT
jgi:hypothetical protein